MAAAGASSNAVAGANYTGQITAIALAAAVITRHTKWEDIIDTQVANWTDITNNPSNTWTNVVDTQSSGWTDVLQLKTISTVMTFGDDFFGNNAIAGSTTQQYNPYNTAWTDDPDTETTVWTPVNDTQ